MPVPLYTTAQAAEHLGLQPRTLEVRRWNGEGPPFVRLSARCVRYRLADLDEWIAGQIRQSTSDTGSVASGSAS